MRRPRRHLTLALLAPALLAGGLAACNQPTSESLTDPREILAKTIASTFRISTGDFRAELQVREAGQPTASGGVAEGEFDAARGAAQVRAVDANGQQLARFTVVDKKIFFANANEPLWRGMPDPGILSDPATFLAMGRGGQGQAPPNYLVLLTALVEGPDLEAAFVGVEDCAAGRCYRTTIEIPPAAVFPAMSKLLGLDRFGAVPPPNVADMPSITIAVLSDTASLRIVEAAAVVTTRQTTIQVRIVLTDPNGTTSIQAPPADQVQMEDGFGTGIGGGGVAPAPMPAATAAPSAEQSAPSP